MDSKIKIALIAVLVILVIGVVAVALSGGLGSNSDNNNSSGDGMITATVYLEGLGETEELTGTGTTLHEILDNALSSHTVDYSSSGAVRSVDGKSAEGDSVWALFKWASPDGWVVISGANYSASLIDGMSIALSYSEKTAVDSKITYSTPVSEVEYSVYFFIKFEENYDDTNYADENKWIVNNINMTETERKNGMWFKGTGSSVVEALKDVIMNQLFPGLHTDSEWENIIENEGDPSPIYYYSHEDGNYGWLYYFLGWTDTKVSASGGEYGTWTYWSQYTFDPESNDFSDASDWTYNDWSLGLYDITEYRYFALVLKTTTTDNSGNPPSSVPSEIEKGL